MSKKNSICFNKPPEPAFLRRIKEQVGYKEGPNVHTKRQALEAGSDDDFDEDDYKPQVVVLKSGDLTAEEVEKLEKQKKEEEEYATKDGKIKFRKPEKRKSTDKDSSKKNGDEKAPKKPKGKTPVLSFDLDEES